MLIIPIVCVVAALSRASPVPEPNNGEARSYGEAQQFLVLHPQVVHPHLSPLKYEQPIIAPITQLGHISTPKEQLYFFYPSSPLSQAPVVSFQRDDGQDFNLISFISNWFASKPAETAAPAPPAVVAQPAVPAQDVQPDQPSQQAEASAPQKPELQLPIESVGEELRPVLLTDQLPGFPAAAKPEKIEINPDAEYIPQQQPQPQPQPQPHPRPPQPAYAPFPLVPQIPDRRVYIVSGQPQFFGNFDAFANPLNPIFSLQPLSAIIPRSNEETKIEAAEEGGAANDAPADDVIVTPAAADLKISPEVIAEEHSGVKTQEVDVPVDVFARSNSRIELIPSEDDAVGVSQNTLTIAEKRISASVQDKSSGGGAYIEFNELHVKNIVHEVNELCLYL